MSNLSIRGIDPDLATTLKQQAQASGKSVNQLVLDVLKEHTGLHKKNISLRNTTTWIFFLADGLIANSIKFKEKLTMKGADKMTHPQRAKLRFLSDFVTV